MDSTSFNHLYEIDYELWVYITYILDQMTTKKNSSSLLKSFYNKNTKDILQLSRDYVDFIINQKELTKEVKRHILTLRRHLKRTVTHFVSQFNYNVNQIKQARLEALRRMISNVPTPVKQL